MFALYEPLGVENYSVRGTAPSKVIMPERRKGPPEVNEEGTVKSNPKRKQVINLYKISAISVNRTISDSIRPRRMK